MKLAKKKRVKQLLLTGIGLAFIIAFIVMLFTACGPQITGGGG